MNFGVIVSWTFVLLALSCSTAHGGESENHNKIYRFDYFANKHLFEIYFRKFTDFQLKNVTWKSLRKPLN